jgi:hypothetical protein
VLARVSHQHRDARLGQQQRRRHAAGAPRPPVCSRRGGMARRARTAPPDGSMGGEQHGCGWTPPPASGADSPQKPNKESPAAKRRLFVVATASRGLTSVGRRSANSLSRALCGAGISVCWVLLTSSQAWRVSSTKLTGRPGLTGGSVWGRWAAAGQQGPEGPKAAAQQCTPPPPLFLLRNLYTHPQTYTRNRGSCAQSPDGSESAEAMKALRAATTAATHGRDSPRPSARRRREGEVRRQQTVGWWGLPARGGGRL